jgi:hypothetical protein
VGDIHLARRASFLAHSHLWKRDRRLQSLHTGTGSPEDPLHPYQEDPRWLTSGKTESAMSPLQSGNIRLWFGGRFSSMMCDKIILTELILVQIKRQIYRNILPNNCMFHFKFSNMLILDMRNSGERLKWELTPVTSVRQHPPSIQLRAPINDLILIHRPAHFPLCHMRSNKTRKSTCRVHMQVGTKKLEKVRFADSLNAEGE